MTFEELLFAILAAGSDEYAPASAAEITRTAAVLGWLPEERIEPPVPAP